MRHLALFPPFEDYDRVHKGNVTTGQVMHHTHKLCTYFYYIPYM